MLPVPPAAAAMTGARSGSPHRLRGRGLCAEILPELITLDDWGFPVVRDGVVPGRLRGEAREAVRVCPKLALRLE